mmetsp:Transcript_15429/g.22342  ORF Transcript_15429/g.22342 Transcript_15429/m.22342 type:complete len:245 (+) Transcript_15429:377-1111(+)
MSLLRSVTHAPARQHHTSRSPSGVPDDPASSSSPTSIRYPNSASPHGRDPTRHLERNAGMGRSMRRLSIKPHKQSNREINTEPLITTKSNNPSPPSKTSCSSTPNPARASTPSTAPSSKPASTSRNAATGGDSKNGPSASASLATPTSENPPSSTGFSVAAVPGPPTHPVSHGRSNGYGSGGMMPRRPKRRSSSSWIVRALFRLKWSINPMLCSWRLVTVSEKLLMIIRPSPPISAVGYRVCTP